MDSDAFLKLLQDDFDEKVFVSKVFESNDLRESLKMVSERLSELDASISQHVSKHNSELLSQAVELENFYNIVGSVESRIMSVSGNVNLIKQKIAKHFDNLSTQVTLIRRMGLAYETLRSVLWISSLMKKLDASSADIVQTSECIKELEVTYSSLNWDGITILEENHRNLLNKKERVNKEAWELIRTSFHDGDQTRLGLALHAFDNLLTLPQVIQALVSDWQTEIEDAIKSAVDVEDLNKRAKGRAASLVASAAPGGASLSSGGGHAAAFRSLLWAGIDRMVTVFDRSLTRVRMLCITLQRTRSSVGSILTSKNLASRLCNYILEYLDDIDKRDCCAAIMMVLYTGEAIRDCESTLKKIRKSFEKVDAYMVEECVDGFFGWIVTCMKAIFEPPLRRRSSQLKEALESDYPRLLKLFLNVSGYQQLPQPVESFLAPFEKAYLGRSLTRLFDCVNSTFVGVTASESNGENLPRLIDAERMVQTVSTELAHSAAVRQELFCKVARNVAKMVTLLSSKVETLIVRTPEAFQVSIEGLPTAAQQKNTYLVNFTCAFVDRLRMAFAKHTTTQRQKLEKTPIEDPQTIVDQAIMNEVSSVCLSALDPFLTSIRDYIIDQILPRMHKEISDSENLPTYVQDLQAFVNRMKTEYMTGFSVSFASGSSQRSADKLLFTSGECAARTGLQTRVIPRCLDVLALHASLFRPCTTEVQRSHLTRITAALEVALVSLSSPSVFTEAAFARLHALRQLFSFSVDDILETIKSQDPAPHNSGPVVKLNETVLPVSLVLHHMIARSSEIPLPHQAAHGWSLERYVRWFLSSADEATRLAFIRKALEVYTEQVEERKQRTYPPIYLAIQDLLEQRSRHQ